MNFYLITIIICMFLSACSTPKKRSINVQKDGCPIGWYISDGDCNEKDVPNPIRL